MSTQREQALFKAGARAFLAHLSRLTYLPGTQASGTAAHLALSREMEKWFGTPDFNTSINVNRHLLVPEKEVVGTLNVPVTDEEDQWMLATMNGTHLGVSLYRLEPGKSPCDVVVRTLKAMDPNREMEEFHK